MLGIDVTSIYLHGEGGNVRANMDCAGNLSMLDW